MLEPLPDAIPLDAHPPLALDEFARQTGRTPMTIWRWRQNGWLPTINICGKPYVTRAAIAEFNRRATAGEFAATAAKPPRAGKSRKTSEAAQ